MANIPNIASTIVVNPNAANAPAVLERGVKYRVAVVGTAATAAYLNIGAIAAADTLMAIPTGTVEEFLFGTGTGNITVNCYAAANIKIFFTPY